MAEKISIIIISVDLDCHLCAKKIRKTLRKFPEIQRQTFDIKQNTVTVSGAFDPEKLSKCIRCRAGKSVKDILIVRDPPPKPKPDPPKPKPVEEPPKPKPDPPKPKPVEEPPKPKPDPPKPKPVEEPPKPKPDPPKPKPVEEPPKPKPDPPKPAPPKPDPRPPVAFPPPYVCYPWYEGYEGGPCSSGWPYYPVHPGPPPPGACCRQCYEGHGGGPCTYGRRPSSCGFFSEEDQSCSIM